MESFFALLQKNILDRCAWYTRQELRTPIVPWVHRTFLAAGPAPPPCQVLRRFQLWSLTQSPELNLELKYSLTMTKGPFMIEWGVSHQLVDYISFVTYLTRYMCGA